MRGKREKRKKCSYNEERDFWWKVISKIATTSQIKRSVGKVVSVLGYEKRE